MKRVRGNGKIDVSVIQNKDIADILKQMDKYKASPSPASLDRLVEYIIELEAKKWK